MSNISTNQVMQFFVTASALSASDIKTTKDGKKFLEFSNALGETRRTDLIDPKKILSVTLRKAEYDTRKLKTYLIELNDDPVAGQHYIVTLNYSGFVGNEDTYHKFGEVYATAGMTKAQFYTALAKSLLKSQTEVSELFSVLAGSTKVTLENVDSADFSNGLVIMEPTPYWELGTFPETPTMFTVTTSPIVVNSEEVYDWATISDKTEDAGVEIPNTHRVADMEHFAMGEVGAQTNYVGYPYSTKFKYIVDADDANGYNIVVVHYAFEGDNHDAHYSEKDLVVVAKKAVALSTFASAVAALNNLSVIAIAED